MQSRQEKRLQVFLASCGVASRRKCEELIEERRVAVNGRVVTRQGVKVDPQEDVVTLDGRRLQEKTQSLYIALNKPAGFICTNADPQGRPLAVDLLGSIARKNHLFSVGRLDLLSSGLIFFTNDGEFARQVAHPSAGIEKEYLVETRKPVSSDLLEELRRGINVAGVRYRIERYTIKSAMKISVILREGKNRELRNMFAARRIELRRIHRIRIGTVFLDKLAPGEFRFLSRREVNHLLSSRRGKGGKGERGGRAGRPRAAGGEG